MKTPVPEQPGSQTPSVPEKPGQTTPIKPVVPKVAPKTLPRTADVTSVAGFDFGLTGIVATLAARITKCTKRAE